MLRIGMQSAQPAADMLPELPRWMAALLVARGVDTPDAAQAFLHPSREQLLPPAALPGITEAAAVLAQARAEKTAVAVYGDYDVDGVSATAIMLDALRMFGLRAAPYIPDRHQEGYGLNLAAVERLAGEYGVLLTVDCGITAVSETAAAKAAGMRVIITDHHQPGEKLPQADALVSPLLGGYPFPYLCGAGVAWKLALALVGERAESLMELAALATVADMVPLLGENRTLVALGLEGLSATRRAGLRALMEVAGIEGSVCSEQAAFQLAPRLNACGRMESAMTALRLLQAENAEEARALALRADGLNQARKNAENAVIDAAEEQARAMDLTARHGLVVSGAGWNSGVVGLAAGRLAEKYAYPTVALAVEGEQAVGSARSAGDVDLYRALSECADLFLRFGGHRQAAGLTIATANIPAFAERFSRAVAAQTGGKPIVPVLPCDGEMTLAEVTEETIALLSRLEPFGMGNPAPRFLCRGAEALSLRPVGTDGKHLRCLFQQDGALREGIFFGGGAQAWPPSGRYRMLMTPTLNTFRGKSTAQCRLFAMEVMPETLPRSDDDAALALLRETLGKPDAAAAPAAEVDALMRAGRGTLLICRCLETALEMRARYPEAEFFFRRAEDPRANNGVLLDGAAREACESYRHVVLCDGDLGETSAGAALTAMPVSLPMRALLSRMRLDKERLRAAYVALRAGGHRDVRAVAEAMRVSLPQAVFALITLSQIGLISVRPAPFSASLLPLRRCDPSESPFYRLAWELKEEDHGIYGL
ncbi:MAG: single-stranded-DNA-specific exonuclease RecJ [Clostridiales bacterium]|nr:single-stranded-DNA-specific exonuclease RecJ [Clostridiales bacterium]